ncbi:MAG TPA: hypothetical protein VJ464_13450 [Blastocatellia bacterium]|nr:hypothetical protein [Blastocatellia bacterium]
MAKKKLTEHQKKLIRLITDNLGNSGPAKTLEELMLEAGYSPESARQQSNIMAGIRPQLEPIIEKLQTRRDRAAEAITDKKLDKASARDAAYVVDLLTKNIQLLSGKATERPNNVITGLENLSDEQLDELIKDRKNRAG